MKVAIIQPEYSQRSDRFAELFHAEISALDACDDSMDIIVMPEYSDIPIAPDSNEAFWNSIARCHEPLLEKAAHTARRCHAFVFVNGVGDRKNTTFAFNRSGELFGKYFKRHLTEGEISNRGLTHDYTLHASPPYIIEAEGLRFAFLTCYDFYFYEEFSGIARQNVDIIIGCSHQRSDTHDAIELFSRFAAYNCNAYLLRASVSLGSQSEVGGGSMVVSPRGEVLLNMKSRVGVETVMFDPKGKHYKPAGFGNAPAAHYEYVERGRRPWNYRPAGSAITLPDSIMPYPRLCVQGGSSAADMGLLPLFGAAVALSVHEISFKVLFGAKGELLAVPENDHSCVTPTSFPEILRKLSCHAIMNIYISDENEVLIRKVISLIAEYDCDKYVYFSSKNKRVLKLLRQIVPQFSACYCADTLNTHTVAAACSLGCKRIRFHDTAYSVDTVVFAHNNGLSCSLLLNGDVACAKQHLAAGIDTLITENYTAVFPFAENTQTIRTH